jgi:hypothetical protein
MSLLKPKTLPMSRTEKLVGLLDFLKQERNFPLFLRPSLWLRLLRMKGQQGLSKSIPPRRDGLASPRACIDHGKMACIVDEPFIMRETGVDLDPELKGFGSNRRKIDSRSVGNRNLLSPSERENERRVQTGGC